jgi:two-component system nitrogen regulation sensor histidine kinase GlnL
MKSTIRWAAFAARHSCCSGNWIVPTGSSPDWIEYTEVIINEVDRLKNLINNMLGPANRLQRKLINIYEVLEHIYKIIHAAEPERIEIHRDYDPSIPSLMADRDLLIQAFLNIARNAVQAIEGRGEITFRTRIARNVTIGQVTHPLAVQIDITDSGRGVPRELSETIFLPMITDKPDGSGLGLPIAQDIISRHGGSIQLHSSDVHSSDAGTTFSTILPLEQS